MVLRELEQALDLFISHGNNKSLLKGKKGLSYFPVTARTKSFSDKIAATLLKLEGNTVPSHADTDEALRVFGLHQKIYEFAQNVLQKPAALTPKDQKKEHAVVLHQLAQEVDKTADLFKKLGLNQAVTKKQVLKRTALQQANIKAAQGSPYLAVTRQPSTSLTALVANLAKKEEAVPAVDFVENKLDSPSLKHTRIHQFLNEGLVSFHGKASFDVQIEDASSTYELSQSAVSSLVCVLRQPTPQDCNKLKLSISRIRKQQEAYCEAILHSSHNLECPAKVRQALNDIARTELEELSTNQLNSAVLKAVANFDVTRLTSEEKSHLLKILLKAGAT